MAQVIVDEDGGGGGSTELYVRRYFFVTGNPNGGTGGGNTGGYATCKPGDSYAVALNRLSVSRSGYGFRGWSTSSSGAVQYSASGYVVFNVVAGKDTYNLTLYAVWTRLSTLTYQANASGVTDVPAAVTAYQGSSNALSSTYPKKTGFIFKGWNTKADGTGTMYQPGTKVTFSTGGNWNLFAIWKEVGIISADDVTIGNLQTVTISNSTSGLTFTVSYSVAGQTGWISGPEPSSNKNLSWTPSTDLAQYITNAEQATLTLTLSTYSGSSLIGTATKNVTLSIPDYMTPTISSYTMTETAEMPEEFVGYWVREVSIPELNIVASGSYGSTISSYKVEYEGGTIISTTNPFSIGVLNASGQLRANITVTDSRGRTATTSFGFTVYDHYMPSIMFGDVYRDSSSPANIVVNYRHVIAPVNNLNAKKIKIGYTPVDEGNYEYAPDIVPDVYSGDGSYTILDTNHAKIYSVKIQVIDSVGSSEEYFVEVPRYGGIYIDVNPDDDTIAMHGEAPGDGVDHWFEKILGLEQGNSAISVKSSGTTYVRIAKLTSRVERSRNLATRYTISSIDSTINANSTDYLGQMLENLTAGTYTVSWLYEIKSIPEGANQLKCIGPVGYYDANNGTHTIAGNDVDTYTEFRVGDKFKRVVTFTLTNEIIADASSFYINMSCRDASFNYFNVSVSDFMLEVGDEDTDFEPYVDMNNRELKAPFFITYLPSSLDKEVKLTIQFDGAMNNTKFYIAGTSLGEADLVQISEEQWDLYVKKINYDDIIDVLSVVNPTRNKDLWIDWDNTVLSSLPTGYIQATWDPYSTGYLTYASSSTDTVSLTSGSWKTVATITLPRAGRWLIYFTVRFASNATGRRWALLSKSQDSNSNVSVQFCDERPATSGDYTFLKAIDCQATTGSTTYYVNAWQNSGGNLTCLARISALRIL